MNIQIKEKYQNFRVEIEKRENDDKKFSSEGNSKISLIKAEIVKINIKLTMFIIYQKKNNKVKVIFN